MDLQNTNLLLEAISRAQSRKNKMLRRKRRGKVKSPKRRMAARKAARRVSKAARSKRSRKASRTRRRLNNSIEFNGLQSLSEVIRNANSLEDIISQMQHQENTSPKGNTQMKETAVNEPNLAEDRKAFLVRLVQEGMTPDDALSALDESWKDTAGKVAKFLIKDVALPAYKIKKEAELKAKAGSVFGSAGKMIAGAGLLAGGVAIGKGLKAHRKETETLKNLEVRQHRRDPDIYPHPRMYNFGSHPYPSHGGGYGGPPVHRGGFHAMPVPHHRQRMYGENEEQHLDRLLQEYRSAKNPTAVEEEIVLQNKSQLAEDLVVEQLLADFKAEKATDINP